MLKSIHIDKGLHDEVKQLTAANGQSLKWFIEDAIKEKIKREAPVSANTEGACR